MFSSAGAGVKTNLLFFTKGGPTERVWYYDLSDVKVTKKQPLTLDRFDDVLRPRCLHAPTRTGHGRSRATRSRARSFDLKAVNPNAKRDVDTRTPQEILAEIEARHAEVGAAIQELRTLL